MSTKLNPNLLAEETTNILNAAAAYMQRYRKRNLFPELVLLALIESQNTAGRTLLESFAESRGADLNRLERQSRLAAESRRDLPGDLAFITRDNQQVELSRQMIIALDEALSYAEKDNEVWINSGHLLAALSHSTIGTGGILRQYGITPKSVTSMLGGNTTSAVSTTASAGIPAQTGSSMVDYVAMAKAGQRRAVYMRESLLHAMTNMLSQRVNQHIILLGPVGVGKRTLVYSLALRIADNLGPADLQKVVQIDEAALIDNPVRAVRSGINQATGGILFLPQIHRFFGGPLRTQSSFAKAGADIQKAFLGNDPVVIGTTSEIEYDEQVSKASAIAEHCQLLIVQPTNETETLAILQTLKPQFEADYGIKINDEALPITASLARRYLGTVPLPRSAEHLMHRTAALVSMSAQQHLPYKSDNADITLDAEDVTLTISQWTGIPVAQLGQDERTRYASMVEHLHNRIIGQEEAVMAVSRAVKTARVGLKDKKRPIGGFLFLGPTGVGKTELAKALAEFMFGDEDAMLQLDMSEFQNESTINRLIGSPLGYVDSEAGGQLTERVRQQPYLIVLFDEVEKAHPRVIDILLQVLEEGRLTDGRGNVATFSETVIIMTSNQGDECLTESAITDEVRECVMESVESHFRPEFLNRLDEIVIFHPLNNDHLNKILNLMLNKEIKLAADRGLTLNFTNAAKTWMLAQNEHPEWGARPLRRIIQRNVREPLADFLLKENPDPGTTVRVGGGKNGLTFKTVN